MSIIAIKYLEERSRNRIIYSNTHGRNTKCIMEVTQSHKIHDKKSHSYYCFGCKDISWGIETPKCWGKLRILNKHIVLAFLFQAIISNVCMEIIFNRDFYGKTFTGNEGNILGINMMYLLLHMLVMTLNKISKQNKSYDVWCQHNKMRLFPSKRSILKLHKDVQNFIAWKLC